MRFLFAFFLQVLVMPALSAPAQDCKPHRTNRHKAITVGRVGGVGETVTTWTTSDGRYYLALCADTLLVSKDGAPPYPLRVRARRIIMPYILYEKDGETWTDTLTPTGGRATHRYFDNIFYSGSVLATTNAARRSLRYYRASGKDSILLIRHAGGTPKELTRYNTAGSDSLKHQWSADGVLLFQKKWANGEERTYTLDGILHTHRYDTVGRRGFCFKEYYSSGSLRSVKYFVDQQPVFTWRYYDEDGRLSRTEKKAPVPAVTAVVEAPLQPEMIYTFVEQMVEFRGDAAVAFTTGVTELFCRTHVALKGRYAIRFMIGEDGSATLTNVQGANAVAIRDDLTRMLAAMPKWRPAMINGRTVKVTMGLGFKVEQQGKRR